MSCLYLLLSSALPGFHASLARLLSCVSPAACCLLALGCWCLWVLMRASLHIAEKLACQQLAACDLHAPHWQNVCT